LIKKGVAEVKRASSQEFRKVWLVFLFFLLLVFQRCSFFQDYGGDLIFQEENSEAGFQYPYYLFIPEDANTSGDNFLVVEPNNSGFVSDDLAEHIKKAKRNATRDFYLGNYVSRNMKCPLLVPVFPRSKSHWKIYTHSLDRDVVLQKNNSLERIDLQLIAMTNDAKKILEKRGIQIHEQILMTGFSASGTFVNRFTLIHPEKVLAVAAGGLNGLLMLPLEKLEDQELIYPVGTGDFEALFGAPFNFEAFQKTPQFLFMGALDSNDAIPYDDAFDPPERDLIYQTLGKTMLPDRWEKCSAIYRNFGIEAQYKIYQDIGHAHPDLVKQEVVQFFRAAMNRRRM